MNKAKISRTLLQYSLKQLDSYIVGMSSDQSHEGVVNGKLDDYAASVDHGINSKELLSMKDTMKTSFVDSKTEPIAIIGYSLNFPQGATSPEAFWAMLAEKRDVMTEYPSDRANIGAFHRSDGSRADTV
jgi:hypothetical protein